MRIGVIGGTERSLTLYEELAAAHGSKVEFHDGKMAGRGTATLDTMVQRSDLVVIITQINSHAAVRRAQKYCRKQRRPVLIVRRFGLHAFSLILQGGVSAVQTLAAQSHVAA